MSESAATRPFVGQEFDTMDGEYCVSASPFKEERILQHICSYVGDKHYRFIGGVNQIFHKSYLSLYPTHSTYVNLSTIGHARILWRDIQVFGKDDPITCNTHRRNLWRDVTRRGSMDVVQYIYALLCQTDDFARWKHQMCPIAAGCGRLDLLQWACTAGIVLKDDPLVCQYAIGNGQMMVFRWAMDNGFHWNRDQGWIARYMAADDGHLEALKWLHTNGCSLSDDEEMVCMRNAAKGGHEKVVEWLHNIGCDWDEETFEVAVNSCQGDVLGYLLENDCPRIHTACRIAASLGNWSIVELLQAYGCHWDDTMMASAAAFGHIEVIDWALSEYTPWSELACHYAAGFGQLDTLKWLRKRDCPWDARTTTYASTDEIYLWAVKNDCPVAKGNPRKRLRVDFGRRYTSRTGSSHMFED